MSLVLTAHGSADPRAAANTHAVADQIRHDRPGLDVRVAFCEQSVPNLVAKAGLKVVTDEFVRQTGYPSRVLIARKK